MSLIAQAGQQTKGRNRLTMDGLCAVYHVSHEAVLAHIRRRDDPLPAMRFGRRWLFDQERVEKWLERQAKQVRKRRA